MLAEKTRLVRRILKGALAVAMGCGGTRTEPDATVADAAIENDGGYVPGDIEGPCKPIALDARSPDDDSGGACADFFHLPCNSLADGSVRNCYVTFEMCEKICIRSQDDWVFNCQLAPISCEDGGLIPDADLVVECARCVGIPGRRPAGLVESKMGRSVAAFFETSAYFEAASVLAFRDLERSLASHRAPRELVLGARRARRDEARHAKQTSALARMYGGKRRRVRRRAAREGLEAILVRNAVEGCVGEMYAALVAAWQARHANDPRVAKVMKWIARDEARHAALSWAIFSWGAERLGRKDRRQVDRALALGLRALQPRAVTRDLVYTAGHPTVAEQERLIDLLVCAMKKVGLLAPVFLFACSSTPASVVDAGKDVEIAGDPVDVPIDGLSKDQIATFNTGDELFGLPLREADGLGPLYIRAACASCHTEGLRGPGSVQKMSVVLGDGVTAAPDQSSLTFGHTVRPLLAAGAKTPIAPSTAPGVKLSLRVGPPIIGRGYMEAVLASEMDRMVTEQAARSDGIHGRINHVAYGSEPNPDKRYHSYTKGQIVYGRFGLKARVATLDDFAADALQGDMGITSPLRPTEHPNPDGLIDDLKPGVDVTIESMNTRADYMRLTAIPARDLSAAGQTLFQSTKCGVCHMPTLKTRPDYPIAVLAGIDAPIFTDMLLHDMGSDLADGMVDGEAQSRDWKTPPLIGLRFLKTYLHDSRAHSIEEAILNHRGPGSEANTSIDAFDALSAQDKTALTLFVSGL